MKEKIDQAELTEHIEEVKRQNEKTHEMLETAAAVEAEHHTEIKQMLEDMKSSAVPMAIQDVDGEVTRRKAPHLCRGWSSFRQRNASGWRIKRSKTSCRWRSSRA